MKANTGIGTCKYCGQQMNVMLPEDTDPEAWGQEALDLAATDRCDCPAPQRKYETAIVQIKQYFRSLRMTTNEEPQTIDEMEKIVKEAIRVVAFGYIASVKIGMLTEDVWDIRIKGDVKLYIRRTYKGMQEWEF